MRIAITQIIILSFFYTTAMISCSHSGKLKLNQKIFNEYEAYDFIKYQLSLGARIPNSQAHNDIVIWLKNSLVKNGWLVSSDKAVVNGHELENIIAKWGTGDEWIIIGAHYDNRIYADNDPIVSNRQYPVPGANDGASGVSVLLELSNSIPHLLDNNNKTIWLVFFDLEDDGNIKDYDWIMGSRHFVETLNENPDQVVIIDMIGDKELNIYEEYNSDKQITEKIWNIAKELGYSGIFIPKIKYHMLDDHIPFIEKGIPAIDIIDFDYPYWHTINDTADKVSPDSLFVIGKVLINYLLQ